MKTWKTFVHKFVWCLAIVFALVPLAAKAQSAAYSSITFTESSAFPSQFPNSISVDLSNATWNPFLDGGPYNGTLFSGLHYSITGTLPQGLTLSIKKETSTRVRISLSGTADVSGSDVNIQIVFKDGALNGIPASSVAGLSNKNILVDFTVPKAYNPGDKTGKHSYKEIFDTGAIDHSSSGTVRVKLAGVDWTTLVSVGQNFQYGTHFSATDVPLGLQPILKKVSTNEAELTYQGNALSHLQSNSVGGVIKLTFTTAALNQLNASNLKNSFKTGIYFDDPYLSQSGAIFQESVENDGSIANVQDVTINGDNTWSSAIANGGYLPSSMYSLSGTIPSGLSLRLQKMSPTVVRMIFDGAATTTYGGSYSGQLIFNNTAFNKLNNGVAVIDYLSQTFTIRLVSIFGASAHVGNDEILTTTFGHNNEIQGFSVAPNPSTGEVRLTLPITQTGMAKVRVLSMLGAVVFETTQQMSAGEQTMNLNLSHVTAGLYTVEVQMGVERYTQKFMISR